MKTLIKWVTLSVLLSSAAQANWDAKSIGILKSFKEMFSGPHVSTVWGSIRFSALTPPSLPTVTVREVKSTHFEAGSLQVLTSFHESKKGHYKAAPLLVFVSGIFSDYHASRSVEFVRTFAALGYHVVFIPNPWSEHYIDKKPRSLPGDFEYEAETALEIIGQIKSTLGASATSTNIVGESYGGFLTSVILAEDAKAAVPLIDGTATLLSPPLNMGLALKNLDATLDQYFESFINLSMAKELGLVIQYYLADKQSKLSKEAIDNAGPLFVYGLITGLSAAVATVDRVYGLKQLPTFRDDTERDNWNARLRLRDYVIKFNKDSAVKYSGDLLKIEYWLNKTRLVGTPRLRILTSRDDVLNTNENKSYFLDSPDAYMLPNGGHSGYVALPWFKELLKSAFTLH